MRNGNALLRPPVADAPSQQIANLQVAETDIRAFQFSRWLIRHEEYSYFATRRMRDLDRIVVVAISTDHRHAIEVIMRAAVDKIDGKRNIYSLFCIILVTIALKPLQALNVAIGRLKCLPTTTVWLCNLWRAVKASKDEVIGAH